MYTYIAPHQPELSLCAQDREKEEKEKERERAQQAVGEIISIDR